MEPDSDQSDLLPVRMLNEYAYCPRLFHLMHVEGRWSDNHYTVDGKHVHRRVDRLDQVLPQAEEGGEAQVGGDEPPVIARSVPLSSETLGLTGKLDLVSCDPEGGEAMPVETKRGRVPENEERSWEPERVQVMAQALLLREHEGRLEQMVTHPVFDYRVSWRTVIKTQARLLSRFLRGDIAKWECLTVR